jgi:hypothetical protein
MASSTPNQLSIVANGRVIRGRVEVKEYAERHGLCHICGLYQTHRRVGYFWLNKMEPLTSADPDGVVTVYKGYCIQPTCYTSVDQVKEILGEITSRPRLRYSEQSARTHTPPPSAKISQPAPSGSGSSFQPPSVANPSGSFQPQGGLYTRQGSGGGSAPSRPISNTSRGQPENGYQRPEARISRQSPPPPTLSRQRGKLREIAFDPSAAEFQHSSSKEFSHGSAGSLALPVGESFPQRSQDFTTTSRSVSSGDRSLNRLGSSSFDHSATDFEGSNNNNSSGQIRGDFDHLVDPGGLRTIPSIHKYNSPILEHLDSLVSDGDYLGFLNYLETHATEPDLVVEGFAMFTSHVVSYHLAKPSGTILPYDGWVKTIKGKMEKFMNDRDVVRQGLLTLLSLSTLKGNYKKSMVGKGTNELVEIIDIYAGDQEIRDLVCAFFDSMSVNEKEGLNAKSPGVTKVIRKLAEVVAANDFGQEYALRALFHLSVQKKKSPSTGKSLYHDIRNIISGENMIRAMLNIIQSEGVPETVVSAAMHLLWRVSVPKQEDECEMDAIVVSTEFIGAVVITMNQCESNILLEACCGLLSNLAIMPTFPRGWAQPSADVVCEILSKAAHKDDEGINICGSQALCNLLSDSARRALIMSNYRVVHVVLGCMPSFPKCETLNEICCLSIAHACLDDKSAKAAVVAAGGLERVRAAFYQFVTSVADDNPSMYVKDAALCAMASLSGCQEGALNITQTGLIEDLEAILAVETDSDFVAILQVIANNSRTGAANGFSSGSSDILRQQPGRLPHLLRDADLQQAESILQDLRNLLTDSDVPDAVKLAPFADEGFGAILETMNLYRGSSPIQEEGCGILAQVYYRVPLTNLNAPTQLTSGSWALIHTQNAIDTIRNAMRSNRGNVVLQEYACYALSNFLAPLCEREQSSSDKQVVSHWVDPSLKDVLDAMAVNQDDVQVHISAIHLFWILSSICNPDDRKRWTLRVLQQIFDSMQRFPRNRDLIVTACDALMALQNDEESLDFMGSATGINALMDTIGPENEEVVVASSTRILASLLKKVYTASGYIMQNSEATNKLILCMAGNQGNSYIQISICSILESIITLEDYHVRGSIGDKGGVKAICDALIFHGSDEVLVKHACGVLSSVVPAAHENVLYEMRGQLGGTMINAVQLHMENPEVQSAVIDVLSTCCGQDEYFKRIVLSDPKCIGLIVQSMNLHLGSAELQKSGCSLIWVLSGFENSKEIIGMQGGISAIVNAMLAHSDHASVQKEGLTAVKNLATASCNKPLIASALGEDAVLYALWIHLRDPQVVSGAFSALNNIAVDSETRQVGPMKEEVMQVVLIAMKRFSEDELVQKNACFLLKSCSYSDFNLKLMTRSSEKLIPLLFHAAEAFPQTCGDRAMGVVRKIEQYH